MADVLLFPRLAVRIPEKGLTGQNWLVYESNYFCIDVTFEMRTVLYGIRLFIDNIKRFDRVFISK